MQTVSDIKDIAIRTSGLSKTYRYRGILSSLFARGYSGEVEALKNFDIEIKKGEVLGLIGNNGSGKSTLLKVLSGVTSPTSGTAEINGSLFAAIEVTGGFNQDLSGYDNIILTSKIWGLKETVELLKRIVEFSELGDFIHLPVKKYSTGMISRLATSLIIHSDADIMLLDEVLNGSDISFRRKIHLRIIEEKERGKTIVIASHVMNDILALCNRAIIIDNGKKIYDGNPFNALHLYREKIKKTGAVNDSTTSAHCESSFISITEFNVTQDKQNVSFTFFAESKPLFDNPVSLAIIIYNHLDSPSGHSFVEFTSSQKKQKLLCAIPAAILNEGHYYITIAAFSEPELWMFAPRIINFSVANDNRADKKGIVPGILLTSAEWKIENT